jgi:hypothetical protein
MNTIIIDSIYTYRGTKQLVVLLGHNSRHPIIEGLCLYIRAVLQDVPHTLLDGGLVIVRGDRVTTIEREHVVLSVRGKGLLQALLLQLRWLMLCLV